MKMKIKDDFICFIKFGVVGVSNTLINWICFFLLNHLGIYYIIANVLSYAIAIINSFIWNSKWVFRYTENKFTTIKKFILLNLFGLIINTFILYILVSFLFINEMKAVIISTIFVMGINYVCNKLWVFKR